jgi:hypothetical protein
MSSVTGYRLSSPGPVTADGGGLAGELTPSGGAVQADPQSQHLTTDQARVVVTDTALAVLDAAIKDAVPE